MSAPPKPEKSDPNVGISGCLLFFEVVVDVLLNFAGDFDGLAIAVDGDESGANHLAIGGAGLGEEMAGKAIEQAFFRSAALDAGGTHRYWYQARR